ncbi:MAG TPA: TetR/AcrR family transcriptional regulator [Streptosporangiaceae bacterium]|nr:TetR/AcrR family transcriptional regulator [Streptosporangiaceae bacterium]
MRTADGDGRRARGEPRERAILSAVISLLGETGYEAMTMDAVAARAHASKTTIYRRWPGKAELVRAAVDAHITSRVLGTRDARARDDDGTRDGSTRESGTRDAGSLRDDLLAVMNAMPGHLTPEFMAMMSGLVHAMRTDPQLAASLRSLFDRDAVAEHIIGRAVRRGELPAAAAGPLARLVHEVIEAQIFRQLMTGSGLDSAFAVHVVDDIIMPLLAGSAGSTE